MSIEDLLGMYANYNDLLKNWTPQINASIQRNRAYPAAIGCFDVVGGSSSHGHTDTDTGAFSAGASHGQTALASIFSVIDFDPSLRLAGGVWGEKSNRQVMRTQVAFVRSGRLYGREFIQSSIT